LAQRLTPVTDVDHARSILIVDDDAGVRALLSDWIRVLGYHPYAADGADNALDVLRARPIHVALVDIMMPGRDGIWLINEIQRSFGNTAIIIATGLTVMDPAVTLSPGVIAYLVKPFDFESIGRSVEAAIASQRFNALDFEPSLPRFPERSGLH
jgi:DNA-binding NtrC family response regulator